MTLPTELWREISLYCSAITIINCITPLTGEIHALFSTNNNEFWSYLLMRDFEITLTVELIQPYEKYKEEVRELNLAIRFERKRKQLEKYAFCVVFNNTSGDINVTYKTMLLGDKGVGKSCLLLRYTVMIYIFINFRQTSTKQIYPQSD
jgi:hypothetical protein